VRILLHGIAETDGVAAAMDLRVDGLLCFMMMRGWSRGVKVQTPAVRRAR